MQAPRLEDSGRRRRRPKQERAAATVDALLQATSELLVQRGYEGMTTNHIARRAGVSIGSLYQYFAGKDALLVEIITRHFAETEAIIVAAMDSSVAAHPDDLSTNLADLIRTMINIERTDSALRRALIMLPRGGELGLVDTLMARIEDRVVHYLISIAGQIRPASPVIAARIVTRAVSGVIEETSRRDPSQFEDPIFEDELVALAQRYIFP